LRAIADETDTWGDWLDAVVWTVMNGDWLYCHPIAEAKLTEGVTAAHLNVHREPVA
jgi:hypothetical protein